ncbi:MAG: sensor histidine kinase [Hyphomicrobiaceae bacterium]
MDAGKTDAAFIADQDVVDAPSRLMHALGGMGDAFLLFDNRGALAVCSRSLFEMMPGMVDAIVPGRSLGDILREAASRGVVIIGDMPADQFIAALEDGRLVQPSAFTLELADGRVIGVREASTSDGGIVGIWSDISAEEATRRQIERHVRTLERSNSDLQEFAHVASHDLQEPLRKIEAFAKRLQLRFAEELPAEGADFIERMLDATARMRILINELLAYSRVSSKSRPFEPVDLGRELEAVLSDLQVRLDETKAEVTFGHLPVIEADPTQMRQLLQNLLSNALKFCQEGRNPVVTITVEPGEPIEGACGGVETILLKVADRGIGFDNRFKDEIFKIFFRLHGRIDFEGSGVGLATCRKIAERHLGSIDADGRPGEGATFIVRLPVRHQ